MAKLPSPPPYGAVDEVYAERARVLSAEVSKAWLYGRPRLIEVNTTTGEVRTLALAESASEPRISPTDIYTIARAISEAGAGPLEGAVSYDEDPATETTTVRDGGGRVLLSLPTAAFEALLEISKQEAAERPPPMLDLEWPPAKDLGPELPGTGGNRHERRKRAAEKRRRR